MSRQYYVVVLVLGSIVFLFLFLMVSAPTILTSGQKLKLLVWLSLPSIEPKIALCTSNRVKRRRYAHLHGCHPFSTNNAEYTAHSSRSNRLVHLPIDEHRDAILKAVDSSDVVFVTAKTGSGKTTRIPQFILDAMQSRKKTCRIVVTQPRRLAGNSAGCW